MEGGDEHGAHRNPLHGAVAVLDGGAERSRDLRGADLRNKKGGGGGGDEAALRGPDFRGGATQLGRGR